MHWEKCKQKEQQVIGLNMIKVISLFPQAQSPGRGSLEILQVEQRLHNNCPKVNKQATNEKQHTKQ
jgi:hypothetical protein